MADLGDLEARVDLADKVGAAVHSVAAATEDLPGRKDLWVTREQTVRTAYREEKLRIDAVTIERLDLSWIN